MREERRDKNSLGSSEGGRGLGGGGQLGENLINIKPKYILIQPLNCMLKFSLRSFGICHISIHTFLLE